MNENFSTSILLKINADIAGINEMLAGLGALQQKTKDSAKEVETLGGKLKEMSTSGVFALGAAFKVAGMSVEALTDKIREAVTGTTELAHQMHEVERATGLSGEAAQVLAKGGKVSMDELTGKMQRYRALVGQAILEPGGAADKLLKEKLGLDAVTLSAKPMQEQLELVAASFAKVGNTSERAALAQFLFGRNSGAMLGLLENLRVQGFDRLRESVEKTAGVLGDDMSAAILRTEREATNANNRLTLSFAGINLRMLEAKAAIAGLMADHASAISAVGQSLAAVGVGLGVLTAFANIPWGALGTQYGSLMGATLGVAVAGALTLAIADAMQRAIDGQDKALDQITGKASRLANRINRARTPEDAQAGLNEAANLRNDFVGQASVLTKKKQEWIRSGADGLSGNDQEQLTQLTKAIGLLDVVIKKQSFVAEQKAVELKAQDELNLAQQAAVATAEALVRKVKEGADEHARAKLLVMAADGTDQEKLAALDQVLALTKAEYAEKSKIGELLVDQTLKAQTLAALKTQEEDAEFVYLRQKVAVQKKIDADADRERAKRLTAASELQQRLEAAQITAIQENEYLTEKQKQAALYLAYKKEERDIVAQIAAADKSAGGEADGTATKAVYQGEAKRLRDRQAGLPNEVAKNAPQTTMQEAQAGWVRLQNGFTTVGRSIASVMGSAISGISTGIQGLINRTMTWGQAFRSVVSGIAGSVVKQFSDMAAQGIAKWVAMQLGLTTAATAGTVTRTALAVGEAGASITATTLSTTAAVAGEEVKTGASLMGTLSRIGHTIMAALASVWHGAIEAFSALASIPYVGPILGAAAMAAAIAGGMALVGKIGKGFADGGYTGDGAYGQYAGPAHKGEVVFSQADVARGGGVAAVERLRLQGGNSGAGGGLSGRGGAGRSSGSGMAVGHGSAPVNLAFHNTRMDALAALQSQHGRRVMIDFIRQTQIEL